VGEFPQTKETIFAEYECIGYPAYRTRGSQKVLEEAAEYLLKATRPVIIVGGGANHSQANREVIALSEWLAAPVVTTISGQGIMPDDHPLALGVVGDNGFHPYANQAVEESDLLLYVGCKRGSVSTIRWTLPSYQSTRKIIQIDLDPLQLSNNFSNTLDVAGDARLVLQDLIHLLRKEGRDRERSSWVEELNRMRARFWEESRAELQSDAVPIKPQRIIQTLNQRLPSPSIVIADAGTPTPYITRFLKLQGGGSKFLIPRAYGGLGYAIPAAVGASFARPGTRVVALFGDGSLGMSAGELETLVRFKIPAVLIHFNNGGFGWIKALQALHSKSKFLSVDFTFGNMAAVAEGFGLKAFRIKSPRELEEGLDRAFATQGPVFLDVVTEPELSELPPVYSWLKKADKRGRT
jgi:acetolactate synthase-1/2/3 large subunit